MKARQVKTTRRLLLQGNGSKETLTATALTPRATQIHRPSSYCLGAGATFHLRILSEILVKALSCCVMQGIRKYK